MYMIFSLKSFNVWNFPSYVLEFNTLRFGGRNGLRLRLPSSKTNVIRINKQILLCSNLNKYHKINKPHEQMNREQIHS